MLSDFCLDQQPPVAEKRPKVDTIHGDTRVDDYFYLREKDAPEVRAYLEAENAYTDSVMAPLQPLREHLYEEMLGRIQQTDLSVPHQYGNFLYFTRTEEGKQYPIHCRTAVGCAPTGKDDPVNPHAPASCTAEVLLDLNELAAGKPFFAISAFAVSDDGRYLAYTTDVTGFREYTLHVKDLHTGTLLPESVNKVDDVQWAADDRTFFYVVEDAAKRGYRVHRHRLGTDCSEDPIVYEEPDALYNVTLGRTLDRRYLRFGSESHTTTEISLLRADDPTGDLLLVRPREEDHEYHVSHRDGRLYILTNKDAVNFRLVTAPVERPTEWTELIPHRTGVVLDDFICFARHLVMVERVGGLPRLRIHRFDDAAEHEIVFPDPTYEVDRDVNRVYDTDHFRMRYASLVIPLSIFDYHMDTGERVLLKETPVLGGYDRTRYVSEYRHAMANDGTSIPISLVRRRDTPVDGTAPLHLYGYGSYGVIIPPVFRSNRLSLLDRGIIYAIAHVRGGGELGKAWHDAGKMRQKRNSFDDFIACANYLVGERLTSPDRLSIEGGSAGGLLMGAVVNKRPDLFRAVVSHVPFVDVLNTMLDDTLPLTIGEYVEWGNPNLPEDYAVMRQYCPYTNLKAGKYPAMLVRTSLNDSQVMYWEPAKYVAKLRVLKTNPETPLLFHINLAAGHGGASGRYDALKESAFDFAFILTALGKAETPLTSGGAPPAESG